MANGSLARHMGGKQAARTRAQNDDLRRIIQREMLSQPLPERVITSGDFRPVWAKDKTKMAFNPKEHVISLQGREYLEVKWREVWFREQNPTGSILTEIVADAAVRATIINSDGITLATGMATIRAGKGQRWEGRDLEKAETAAIGRALAHAGFGTQFTDEDEDADYLPDSPVERPNNKPASINHDALYEATAFLYSNGKHQENSISKMIKDGLITADMSLERMTAIILAHRAADDLKLQPEQFPDKLGMKLSEWLQAGKSPKSAWETLKADEQEHDVPF